MCSSETASSPKLLGFYPAGRLLDMPGNLRSHRETNRDQYLWIISNYWGAMLYRYRKWKDVCFSSHCKWIWVRASFAEAELSVLGKYLLLLSKKLNSNISKYCPWEWESWMCTWWHWLCLEPDFLEIDVPDKVIVICDISKGALGSRTIWPSIGLSVVYVVLITSLFRRSAIAGVGNKGFRIQDIEQKIWLCPE